MGFFEFLADPADIFGGRAKKEQKAALANSADARFMAMMEQMKEYMPEYQSLRNASDGSLGSMWTLQGRPDIGFDSNISQLDNRLGGINLDKTALNELQKRALDPNQSAWAQMMLGKEDLAKSGLVDTNARQGKAGLSSAFSALASRGGLSAGARERIAKKNSLDVLLGRQGIEAGSAANKLNIGIEDERNKTDILKALPGMQVQALEPELRKTGLWANLAENEAGRKQNLNLANREYATGVDKANLSTKLGDWQSKRDFDMQKYSEMMKAYSADRAGRAQEQSGKK